MILFCPSGNRAGVVKSRHLIAATAERHSRAKAAKTTICPHAKLGRYGSTENAGMENADHLTGVENARPVAMERQSYKKSKPEIVVIVHY